MRYFITITPGHNNRKHLCRPLLPSLPHTRTTVPSTALKSVAGSEPALGSVERAPLPLEFIANRRPTRIVHQATCHPSTAEDRLVPATARGVVASLRLAQQGRRPRLGCSFDAWGSARTRGLVRAASPWSSSQITKVGLG